MHCQCILLIVFLSSIAESFKISFNHARRFSLARRAHAGVINTVDLNKKRKKKLINRYHYEGPTDPVTGTADGAGVLTKYYADGSPQWVYEGHFVQGTRHGNGTLSWLKEVNKYVGEWHGDRKHGVGVMETPRGTYVGDFMMNKPGGIGRYTSKKTGLSRGGEWYRSYQHGKGWKEYADGSRYEGTFFKDFRRGNGTMRWANGDSYTGNWEMDMVNGKGCYNYSDGSHSEGHFFIGKLHFEGNHTWANGDRYVGQWQSGFRHGEGYMTFADGRPEQRGVWFNDKLQVSRNLTDPFEGWIEHDINGVIFRTPGPQIGYGSERGRKLHIRSRNQIKYRSFEKHPFDYNKK